MFLPFIKHSKNLLSVSLIAGLGLIVLTGCTTIKNWAYSVGDKLPVSEGSERCEGLFCFGDNNEMPPHDSYNPAPYGNNMQPNMQSPYPFDSNKHPSAPQPPYGSAPNNTANHTNRLPSRYQSPPPPIYKGQEINGTQPSHGEEINYESLWPQKESSSLQDQNNGAVRKDAQLPRNSQMPPPEGWPQEAEKMHHNKMRMNNNGYGYQAPQQYQKNPEGELPWK